MPELPTNRSLSKRDRLRRGGVSMRLLLLLGFLLIGLLPVSAGEGDTLTVNGTPYTLYGIDAPEMDQVCIGEGGMYPCGDFASEALQRLVGKRAVRCDDMGADPKRPGRRVGRCTV